MDPRREEWLAAIAGALMQSRTVRFFHEHVLVKEPGASEATPLHHDDPYYCVDGDRNVSFWIPLDPVPAAGPGNTLSSPQLFFGQPWNAHNIVTYAPGNYSVDTIDRALEVLTGYSVDSIDAAVQARVEELQKLAKSFARREDEKEGSRDGE